MEIRKNNIRIIFYICTVSIVIIVVFVFNFTFLNTFTTQSEQQISQLSESIINNKKLYVSDTINLTIQSIDIDRDLLISKETKMVNKTITTISRILTKSSNEKYIIDHVHSEYLIPRYYRFILYDLSSKRIVDSINTSFNNSNEVEIEEIMNAFSDCSIKKQFSFNGFLVILAVSDSFIDETIKQETMDKLRLLRLVDDGYIWINEILDYNGGDDYAIRLVHPNFPETEGALLSTNLKDGYDNKPYEIELEGINNYGEIFYDYYYEPMENGSLSHKLTYAKLYKPYNWVIATGVNIDDVDKLIQRETENSTLLLNEIRMKYYKMSLLVILFSLLVIFIFERLMLSLIVKFQDTVNQKNLEIQLEKERIEQFAYLDPLTGLLNRRSMFDKLHKAVDEYNRYKVGFSIAIADIDDFKQVNDNYGHMAGDYLLKRISNLMITYTRTNDSVCRWGGEEFLLLLSHIDISSATSKLEELRQLIEQEDFIYENTKINCTISIGLAYFSSDNATFEDIIKIADLRLYQAKSNGKNQVVSDST